MKKWLLAGVVLTLVACAPAASAPLDVVEAQPLEVDTITASSSATSPTMQPVIYVYPTECVQDVRGRTSSPLEQFAASDVWIYGDSITHQNYAALESAVDFPIARDTRWGRATVNAVDALEIDLQEQSRVPAVVVMAVGTNDIVTYEAMATQVERTRALLPASTTLLWVNTYVDTSDTHGAQLNAELVGIEGVTVIDWFAANTDVTVAGELSPLLGDKIHLSCYGQTVWVDSIAQAIVATRAAT